MTSTRAAREVAHGRRLAAADPERTWGWTGRAGARRAARRAALIAEGAGLRAGMRVLEIGCGTGLFTEAFARSGAHITAVDISAPLIDIAQRRNLPAARVRFVCAPFEEGDLEGGFDAVIGSSVLHHLEVPRALAHIARLLVPGGALSFAEPNMLNPQIWLQKNLPIVKAWAGDSPDETAFVRWTLRRTLHEAGFCQVRLTPFDWLHPSTPARLTSLVDAVGRRLEHLPAVKEFSGSLLIRASRC